ncbi:cupin domain-containing protein [Shewanella gelidimarina]|uniref:cupin domain-containing protein n=1 Tax=Shewanella gelidimarina TaxID=56813 RepID=UPI00200CAC3B|nr:cupin domain-containing protein [Shewanella gelidimarina]MCL1058624.1 cupin domain-containing protein [Shewanella gelidimarina]
MLNMDLSQKVVIKTQELPWLDSPSPTVFRKPLERAAAESGHTTSIVKYIAGARFKSHYHPYGEEILVLEGVFSDEDGDYPAGTYIRNPPGSAHAPFSQDGCVLLVKLNQFDKHDLKTVRVSTHTHDWRQGMGGLQVMPLHEFEHEHVALVKWPAGERFQAHRHFGGEEIFVISGEFNDEHGAYPQYTWLRSPHMSEHFPFVEQDTIIFVKTGHLYLAE